MENSDSVQYDSITIRCNECNRNFCVQIDESIKKTLEEVSKSGCIYCKDKKSAEKVGMMEVLSINDKNCDFFLQNELLSLTKTVFFD